MPGRVLIVDDDEMLCTMLASALARRDYAIATSTSGRQALALMGDQVFDAVLSDVNMEGMGGFELCQAIVASQPDVPVILMTAFGSLENAVSASRAGAYDFVTKPIEPEELALVVSHAVQHRQLREEVRRLKQVLTDHSDSEIMGKSTAMRQLEAMVARVAASDVTALIQGESGVGKELVARALHQRSARAKGPFVALNCAAVPHALFESELFGHAKGAFTDAKQERVGLLLQASGGTVFLDEIGEIPLDLQAKLLRALQERRVRPVGSTSELTFDARLVVATNRDLEADVEAGRFREDLYYRINVVQLVVPPLRARGNDILLLAQHFVGRFAEKLAKSVRGISAPAAERLLAYDWPGNVRELQNAIERAVALTRFEELVIEDLPERVREYRATVFSLPLDNPEALLPMAEVERRYVLRVLDAVQGNKAAAARVLGFDRRTLYRKLERYGAGGSGPVTTG